MLWVYLLQDVESEVDPSLLAPPESVYSGCLLWLKYFWTQLHKLCVCACNYKIFDFFGKVTTSDFTLNLGCLLVQQEPALSLSHRLDLVVNHLFNFIAHPSFLKQIHVLTSDDCLYWMNHMRSSRTLFCFSFANAIGFETVGLNFHFLLLFWLLKMKLTSPKIKKITKFYTQRLQLLGR